MDITEYFDVKINRTIDRLDNRLLSQKYSPAYIDEFLGNESELQVIDKWFLSNDEGGLFIYGKSGCGKSCLVELFCKKYKLNIFNETSINKRKKEILEIYNSIKSYKQTGIFIIDDLETCLQRSDNITIPDLVNLISSSHIRIVFVANSLYINKMSVLCNACCCVEIQYPSFDVLLRHCLSIAEKENIEINDTERCNLETIIRNENCEPRCVINTLHLLSCNPEFTSNRDRDIDIYKAFDVIIDPSTDMKQKLNAFLVDTGTIPILFQENYINFKNTRLEQLDMAESMSIADILHKQLFNHTGICAIETYGLFATLFGDIKKGLKKPVFGLLWTKLSAMYQKRKYIKNIEIDLMMGKLNHNVLYDMNDVYKHLFNHWATKVKNKRKIDSCLREDALVMYFYDFMKFYNIYQNTILNYDLINVVNFNKGKDFTKKTYCSYMEHFYKLDH